MALKLVGSAYLVFLGVQALFGRKPLHVERSGARVTSRGALRQGLFSNLANPKMLAFFTSLLPQFASSFAGLLALGLLFCCDDACLAERVRRRRDEGRRGAASRSCAPCVRGGDGNGADRARLAPRNRASLSGLILTCFDSRLRGRYTRRLRSIRQGGIDEEDLCRTDGDVRRLRGRAGSRSGDAVQQRHARHGRQPDPSPFSQNKQNEPAVAVNPFVPTIAAAGVNDEIDMEACNNRADQTCPFTPGVGVSGVYFSDDSGSTWNQPTYTGWSARDCLGLVGTQPQPGRQLRSEGRADRHACRSYYENGLVADGDPRSASARNAARTGSSRGRTGGGCTTRTSARTSAPSVGADVQGLRGGRGLAARQPELRRCQGGRQLRVEGAGDRQQAERRALLRPRDDRGRRRVDQPVLRQRLRVRRRVPEPGEGGFPEPIVLNSSSDGGDTWRTRQVSPSVDNGQIGGRQDCAVNTDSKGTVYVFWDGIDPKTKTLAIFMIRSFDGGKTFAAAGSGRDAHRRHGPSGSGARRPVVRRCRGRARRLVPDGGHRERRADRCQCDRRDHARLGERPDAVGRSSRPERAGSGAVVEERRRSVVLGRHRVASTDRPDFPAIAISPDGGDVYVTYMSFLQPWQSTTALPRLLRRRRPARGGEPHDRRDRRVGGHPPRPDERRCARVERQRAHGRVPR